MRESLNRWRSPGPTGPTMPHVKNRARRGRNQSTNGLPCGLNSKIEWTTLKHESTTFDLLSDLIPDPAPIGVVRRIVERFPHAFADRDTGRIAAPVHGHIRPRRSAPKSSSSLSSRTRWRSAVGMTAEVVAYRCTWPSSTGLPSRRRPAVRRAVAAGVPGKRRELAPSYPPDHGRQR